VRLPAATEASLCRPPPPPPPPLDEVDAALSCCCWRRRLQVDARELAARCAAAGVWPCAGFWAAAAATVAALRAGVPPTLTGAEVPSLGGESVGVPEPVRSLFHERRPRPARLPLALPDGPVQTKDTSCSPLQNMSMS
jgi:hypothetical protein